MMRASVSSQAWWQRLPECLAAGHDAVLVTVVRSSGSAPRDAGATMLVELACSTDTVGGGNLEFEAIRAARELLRQQLADSTATAQASAPDALLSYTLGPGLRQCCGGAVWLLYEVVKASTEAVANWQHWSQALLRGERLLRNWTPRASASCWRALAAGERQQSQLVQGTARLGTPGNGQSAASAGTAWQQVIGADAFSLRLFGAGQVGRALVQVLAQTEARLQWIDPRPEMALPGHPFGPVLRTCAEPLDAVQDAPAGTWFVVMTHSHTLDFELVEAILRRRDAAFCGLIGSATKAARFRHNLQKQGLDASQLAGLTCPIGIAGLHSKAPATVAIAVAAQVLQLREAALAGQWPLQDSPLIARQR